MKRKVSMVIAFALVAAMAFTACGGSTPTPAGESGSSTSSVAEVSSEPNSTSPSEPAIEPASEEESPEPQSEESTVEESEEADSSDITVYAAEMQTMLDALSELFGDALTIQTSTQGDNTLIITYTLLVDDPSLTAESIAESMAAEGAKMENLASQMKDGGIPSPVVIVKWIGTDGSELFNQEYK